MNILELFNARQMLAYARQRQTRNYIGELLFPSKTITDIDFKYFRGANNIPVMAQVQTFDAEASIADRDTLSYVEGSLPPIKRKIRIGEKELIKFNAPRQGTNEVDEAVRQVYNDVDNMLDAVKARIEWMRMQALTGGAITLSENGVILSVDYGVPSGNKETLAGTDVWSDTANADPIGDMIRWRDALIDATGVAPERSLTSSTQLGYLLQNVKVREAVHGSATGAVAPAINLTQLNQLLQVSGLPPIVSYDLQVRSQAADGTKSSARLFPANKFVMMPGVALGDTLFGPTAEALDLASEGVIQMSDTPGLIAMVYKEKDPPGHWTKAAAIALPTFPNADLVFQATVSA